MHVQIKKRQENMQIKKKTLIMSNIFTKIGKKTNIISKLKIF